MRSVPKRHEATVLFCDIRGFTALFDRRDPLEAFEFANAVLARLASLVESCDGTIDKFTGDGFLAHFGIASDSPEMHARNACLCALRLQMALSDINTGRYNDDQLVVQLGIGINSGTIASGYIETFRKREFTVLGDVVNTASRIEGMTKYFSVDCLVSASTVALAGDGFDFQKMPARRLRGREDEVELYWLTQMSEIIHRLS